eukprot:c18668_g1_i1 orf=508-939(+)
MKCGMLYVIKPMMAAIGKGIFANNPCRVPRELRRRGLQPMMRSSDMKCGVLFVVKHMISTNANGVHYDSHGKEEEEEEAISSISRRSSHLKSQDDIALVAQMKVCAKEKDLYQGNRLHADILKRGLLESNRFVGNTLVNMYAK